ncbi:hypothetical protein LIER_41799 [Lithospermum erythrorhizon]|uniref:Uncharacterized protein n=1 Tax=Lithospermum erythrorhizon TaxID=34254 RepID=A0AAV3RGB8_LITER
MKLNKYDEWMLEGIQVGREAAMKGVGNSGGTRGLRDGVVDKVGEVGVDMVGSRLGRKEVLGNVGGKKYILGGNIGSGESSSSCKEVQFISREGMENDLVLVGDGIVLKNNGFSKEGHHLGDIAGIVSGIEGVVLENINIEVQNKFDGTRGEHMNLASVPVVQARRVLEEITNEEQLQEVQIKQIKEVQKGTRAFKSVAKNSMIKQQNRIQVGKKVMRPGTGEGETSLDSAQKNGNGTLINNGVEVDDPKRPQSCP